MVLRVEHELHRRRASRNIGLMLVLLAFAALVFGLTIAKVQSGDNMKAWDNRIDTDLLPENNGAPPAPSDAPPAPVRAPSPEAAAAAARAADEARASGAVAPVTPAPADAPPAPVVPQ